MTRVIQDLGAVTAYGYAKNAGYTGTEAEFEELMGDLAEQVANIENLTVNVTTLAAGSGATASYENGVLALGIPKGDKGDTGNTGTAATVAVGSVTTLPAGSEATVTNAGTSGAAVLNFGIPKGADGDVSPASMATEYANLTYPVKAGTYCWYSGQAYKAKVDIAQSESWTAAHWEAAAIAEDTAALRKDVDGLMDVIPNKAATIYRDASGELIDITDGADGMALKSVVVDIGAVQDGVGDPSSENIRAITGWKGTRITRTGKNMLGGDLLQDSLKYAITGGTDYPDSRYFSYAYNAAVQSNFTGLSGLSKKTFHGHTYPDSRFKPQTAYTLMFTVSKGSASNSNIYYVYTTSTSVDNLPNVSAANTKEMLRKVTSGAYTLSSLGKRAVIGRTNLYYDESGIFEGDVAASAFEPYKGTSIYVDWEDVAGTVYGGSFDLLTGKLTVTHGQIASYDGETLPGAWISDRDVYAEGTSPTAGAQVVYELAEPVVYELGGHTLTTLKGKNYIWSTTGDVSVTYSADTKTYVDDAFNEAKQITTIQTGKIALSQNYNNLWAVGAVNDNYYLHATSGALVSSADYATTDYIPVTGLKKIYGKGVRYWFYNSEKAILSGKTGVLNNADELIEGSGIHVIDVPDTAVYFRICRYKATTEPLLYSPTPYDEYLYSRTTEPITVPKKLYCLGDSITRGMYAEYGASSSSGPTEYGYPYWIGQVTGYTVVNLGNSGSGWANTGSAETVNDQSVQRNAKDVVDDNTFSDADIITLAYGVNDWKGAEQNVVLGDMTSTSGDGTVIGNMKYCIEQIASKKPTAQIIILLPLNTNRQWTGMATMTEADNWAFGYAYRNNQTLQDYRSAIRTCAEYYNVKVIDLEEICPINRLNIQNVCGDGLHPTKAFYKQMGLAIAPHII